MKEQKGCRIAQKVKDDENPVQQRSGELDPTIQCKADGTKKGDDVQKTA